MAAKNPAQSTHSAHAGKGASPSSPPVPPEPLPWDTVTIAVAILLEASGSVVAELTCAWAWNVPAVVAVAMILRERMVPLAIAPIAQVTVFWLLLHPASADPNDIPAGSVTVATTEFALFGP
jgi:urea transporter